MCGGYGEPMKRRLILLAILAAGSLIGLALAEGVLRLAGVEYPLYPRVENPMAPFMEEPAFVEDAQLFWVKEGYEQTLDQARRGPGTGGRPVRPAPGGVPTPRR